MGIRQGWHCHLFFPPIYSTWQATLTHSSADVCSDSAGAQSPRGALILCKLSDEILNSGQKESDRLCCSPSPSLWLRSRAQQRLQAHLYSWRSVACTSSNVLSLLRRKTDTLWAEEEKCGGGGRTSSLSLSFSCLLQMLTQTWVFVHVWHGWLQT